MTPAAQAALDGLRQDWHRRVRPLPQEDYRAVLDEFSADLEGFAMAAEEEAQDAAEAAMRAAEDERLERTDEP